MASGKVLAKALANAAHHRLAQDIELLDVKKMCSYASFFLIVSGKNKLHLDAIREAVEEMLAWKGGKVISIEGRAESGWIIIDAGEIIIHVFHPEQRSYYNLFAIWGEAPSVPLTFTQKPPSAPKNAPKKPKRKKPAVQD